MPIDFAEHHVAGKHHHFCCGSALIRNRQRITLLVQAQTANQPRLVEVPSVRNARVQTVSRQIVHFVDINRTRKQASQHTRGNGVRLALQQRRHICRINAPVVSQDGCNLVPHNEAFRKRFVTRDASVSDVFQWVTKWPMPHIVQQRRDDEQFGIRRSYHRCEWLAIRQLLQIQQRHPIHTQTVLESRMMSGRVNHRHQTELADAREPAESGGIDETLDAARQRHVGFRRNPNQPTTSIKPLYLG